MVEVLISVTIIALSLLPILYLASHNVETTRLDRVRAAAEQLCHNTLELFGHAEDNPFQYLSQSPAQPTDWVGTNLFSANPYLRDALGGDTIQVLQLETLNQFTQYVTLFQNKPPGMNTLSCKVTWMSDQNHTRKQESVEYVRYVLQ